MTFTATSAEFCDLCGERLSDGAGTAAQDASGLDICNQCLEAMLDASTFIPRAEVGLVGSGGGRS